MKKHFILLPFICALCYLVLTSKTSGPALGASVECTGVTGAASCGGGGCHATAAASSSISTTVQLLSGTTPTTTYTPGGSYTIRVSATNTSSSSTAIFPKFGYQVTAVKGSPANNAGTMSAPLGSHSSTISSINIIEHSSPLTATAGSGGAGTLYSVDVPWTAPVTGSGTVTIRAIINAVNGTGSTAGDVANASSATITEATSSGVAPITGTLNVCVGSTTALADATPGGAWSSGTPANATINASGVVTGIAPGTSVISYITGTGSVTATVTVNPNPGTITGTPAVCPGGNTPLACTPAGGTWSSSNTAIATVVAATGSVTGVTSGTTTISYTLGTGCYSTLLVTVNTVPPVTGTNTVCAGATTTLTHSIPGGTWSSSTPAVATVSTAGIVAGITGGTATISYTFGTSGCYAATVVTVIGDPAITGSATVCVGLTTTLNALPAGGTWSSSNTARATVGASSGIVTGITTGTVTIKYKVTTACGTDSATHAMTVLAASACPTGILVINNQPEAGLQIFPNPNTGAFSLQVAADEAEPVRIVITDVTGRVVKETTIITNTVSEFHLNQPRGVYIVSAATMLHQYTAKMVLQ